MKLGERARADDSCFFNAAVSSWGCIATNGTMVSQK
jgi:hypothetical protein